MCIKILGDKKIRDNKIIILRIRNSVIKIPLAIGAAREILDEKGRIKKAKNDYFFSPYLPAYKFFLFFQISPYLRQADSGEDLEFLIKQYFEKSFEGALKWNRANLESLVDKYFLKFIKNYIPEDYNFYAGYFKKVFLPYSSAHGDFHPENILYSAGKLYFIDWSRYNGKSSRYFDLIDFHIFSRKNKDESWTKAWERKFNNYNNEIFGIKIKREYMSAYGIWRVAEDIRTLKLRSKLNKFKIKKYINFIKILKNSILTYENQLCNTNLR